MVSGHGHNDLAFMRAGRGDWVSKIGADGVQVLGSKSRAEAFAIKIIDANKPALYAASVEVLDQLGWLDAAQRAELEPWGSRAIVNARGLQVGERLPVFRLQGRCGGLPAVTEPVAFLALAICWPGIQRAPKNSRHDGFVCLQRGAGRR